MAINIFYSHLYSLNWIIIYLNIIIEKYTDYSVRLSDLNILKYSFELVVFFANVLFFYKKNLV